jgi:hypothetical protein
MVDGPMPKLGTYPSLEAAMQAIEDFKKRHSQLAQMSLVLHGVQVVDASGAVCWDGLRESGGQVKRRPRKRPSKPKDEP